MGHDHSHASIRVPPRTQRLLLVALAPFLLATVIGIVVLWPSGENLQLGPKGPQTLELEAKVTEVRVHDCPDVPGQESFTCAELTAEIEEGSDQGETFTFDYSTGPKTRTPATGDAIIVGSKPDQEAVPGQPAPPRFFFLDFDRRRPLLGSPSRSLSWLSL